MASLSTSSSPPLAGANCPHCGATCVYEVPLELTQIGVTSVEISCHACAAVFETELPDVQDQTPHPKAATNIAETPALPESGPEFDLELESKSALPPLELEAPIRNQSPEHIQPASGRRRITMLVSITLIAVVAIVGIGIAFMPKVDRTPLTANIVHVEPDQPDQAEEKPQLDQGKTDQVKADQPSAAPTPSPTPTQTDPAPTPPTGPASFNVADSGYTISATELGNVMNISLKIKNNGGEAGRPNSIILHLIAPDGNILLSWSVPPGREALEPLAERRYSAQLIEPPENVSSLQVALD